MSIFTQVVRQPNDYQPTNSHHIWSVSNPNSTTLTDYKYVVDLYLNPASLNPQKFGRIKVSPNLQNGADFDLYKFVWSQIEPCFTIKKDFWGWNHTTGEWEIRTSTSFPNLLNFSNAFEIKDYNQAPTPTIPNRHIASYGLVFGEEYVDGNGDTILDIASGWSGFGLSCVSIPITQTAPYPISPNTIQVLLADPSAAYFETGVSVSLGWSYLHTQADGTFVASGTTSLSTGTYQSTLQPSRGDIVFVYSNQTKCGQKYEWCKTTPSSGWELLSNFCEEGCGSSTLTTIWPGTQNVLSDYNYNLTANQDYASWEHQEDIYTPKVFKSPTQIYGNTFNQFMTIKGDKWGGYTTPGITLNNPYQIFQKTRTHHRGCPIILSWLNSPGFIEGLVELTGSSYNSLSYNDFIPSSYIGVVNSYQKEGEKFLSYTKRIGADDRYAGVESVGYYLTSDSGNTTNWQSYGMTEIIRYNLYDDCLAGDALHFVFLNSLGVWDSITFGAKNIRSYSSEKQYYRQSVLSNTLVNGNGLLTPGNVPYNMDTIVQVEAQSNFVDENDAVLFRDFILSPHAYVLSEKVSEISGGMGLVYSSFLAYPIQIMTTNVEEMKNRYNKLYQYSVIFEYNTLQQFFTSL